MIILSYSIINSQIKLKNSEIAIYDRFLFHFYGAILSRIYSIAWVSWGFIVFNIWVSIKRTRSWFCFFSFVFFIGFVGGVTPVSAQLSKALIEAAVGNKGEGEKQQAPGDAKKSEKTLSSIETSGTKPPQQKQDIQKLMITQLAQFRDALHKVLASTAQFPEHAAATLAEAGPDGTAGWLGRALVLLIISAFVGYIAKTLFQRWARQQFLHLYDAHPTSRSEKIGYLLTRAFFQLLGVALFVGVAVIVYLIFQSEHEPTRQTVFIGITQIAILLTAQIIFLNILAPHATAHRMVALSDADALGMYRGLMIFMGFSSVMFGVCKWMDALGLDLNAHKLALMITTFLSAFLLIGVTIHFKRAISELIAPLNSPHALSLWRVLFSRFWHVIVILYFLVAATITAFHLILDHQSTKGLVIAPIAVAILGVVVYGVCIVIIDRLILPHLDTKAEIEKRADILAEEQHLDALEQTQEREVNLSQAAAEAEIAEEIRLPYRSLIEKAALIITLFGGILLLFAIWGAPLHTPNSFIDRFTDVLLVVFLGYMAYEAAKISIDKKIDEEKPDIDDDDGEQEMGATGESRLATLLPLFRNFLLITIVVIAGMIGLSELGVDIAPLFAGAGVIGLAVGFGSQTLIRDIFSGAFFLIDDSFRKGEYVDIGTVKGSIEKISIRSMQLRHHRGALHTVPFGEIKYITNYSRDWAIMKLTFRVTYDTDVEKVRKLIKKLGQELLQDPEHGHKFLEPLKSQGVLSMEDSAMIVRVKYKTKPGDQFVLRKMVYARIREIFEQNGIQFAHRQVTVQVAENHDGHQDDGKMKQVAAAALGAAAIAAEEGLLPGSAAPSADSL